MLKTFKGLLKRISRGFVREPKRGVFILGGDIAQNGQDYTDLIEALRSAKHGDHIFIVLLENEGGIANVGYQLHDEILNSKAVIHTEARMWSASAALDVLFSGDYVYIPKHHSPVGFGIAHLSYTGSANWKIRDPYTMRSDIERMQFYRPFLTEEQWKRVCEGEDVALHGKLMCSMSPDVHREGEDYCVIKRNKKFDKN